MLMGVKSDISATRLKSKKRYLPCSSRIFDQPCPKSRETSHLGRTNFAHYADQSEDLEYKATHTENEDGRGRLLSSQTISLLYRNDNQWVYSIVNVFSLIFPDQISKITRDLSMLCSLEEGGKKSQINPLVRQTAHSPSKPKRGYQTKYKKNGGKKRGRAFSYSIKGKETKCHLAIPTFPALHSRTKVSNTENSIIGKDHACSPCAHGSSCPRPSNYPY